MKPIGYNVLIKLDIIDNTNDSGLITTVKEQTVLTGEVVGKGNKVDECIKVGAKVKFHDNAGIPIELDKEKYLLLNEDYIHSINL